MSAAITSIRGPGGRAVPVEWFLRDGASRQWTWDTEHFDQALTPMEVWFYAHYRDGVARAWAEPGLLAPNVFRGWQFAGPFLYFHSSPDPDRWERVERSYEPVLAEYGTVWRFWNEFCEPRIEGVCERLGSGALDQAPLAAVADTWGYAWHQTFTSYTPIDIFFDPLVAMLQEVVGSEGMLLAQELVTGGANASQDIDAEVWQLAGRVRADAALEQLVTAGSPAEALAAVRARGGTFAHDVDVLVLRHACRSGGWDFASPTWGERPELVIALVRAQLHGGVAPAALAAASAARRSVALERALGLVEPAHHDRMHALLRGLERHVEVREGRAYWQMTLTGQVRRLLVRHGQRLVREGRLDDPGDVLFLEPLDVEGTPGDLRDRAAAGRAEHAEWCAITPPTRIGTLADDGPASGAAADGVLRGEAASRGVVTARARILLDADDWDRLEPGDVLVCPLSTPAWTPLFGVAAAVVTESGNVYAHPAITAREYGIPAVVAVAGACSRIPDGALVTVDGTAGEVRLA